MSKHVNSHWESSIEETAVLYSSLRFLNLSQFACDIRHPLFRTLGIIRAVPRISAKLKLVTGTHILQTNRASFKQNQVDPGCLLCRQENETIDDFLLHCPATASLRYPIIDTIVSVGAGLYSPTYSPISFLQLVLDHSALNCDIKASDN